jgi:hypothetical protein
MNNYVSPSQPAPGGTEAGLLVLSFAPSELCFLFCIIILQSVRTQVPGVIMLWHICSKPEKQPLLANGSDTTSISRQRLGKHVNAATDTHAITEVLFETVFSTRSVQRGYKEENWGNRVSSVREAMRKRDSWKGASIQRGHKRGS